MSASSWSPPPLPSYGRPHTVRNQKRACANSALPLKALWSFGERRQLGRGNDERCHLLHQNSPRPLRLRRRAARSIRKQTSSSRPISFPKIDASRSQWGGYDAEDGYSDKARSSKEQIISGWLKTLSGRVTVDYGANAGRYSRLAAPFSDVVLAVEPDTMAAEHL